MHRGQAEDAELLADTERVAAAGSESVAESSAYSFGAQVASAAFTAILTLYLVRALGTVQYGDFALAIGAGSLAFLPADFGISSSTARFIAEHRDDARRMAEVLAEAIRVKLVLSAIACGALAALAGPIASAYHADIAWPLRAVALATFAQSMMFLFDASFIAVRRVASDLKVVFLESAVECSMSIVLVILVGGAIGAAEGRAIGYCSGAIFATALGARVFGWPAAIRRRGSASERRRIARYAVPLVLVDSAWTLFSTIDLLLIGAYLGSTKVALFAAPLRLLALLSMPAAAIASGVAPRLARSRDHEPEGDALARALRLVVVFQGVMLAPLIVWARPIVDVLLGSNYHGSISTVRVLSIGAYLYGLAPLVSVSANFLGDAARRIPLMVGAALLNTVIDLFLIPRIGIMSGAIATAAALIVMDAGHIHICRRHVALPLTPLARSLLRTLLAAAAMAAVLLGLGTNPSAPLIVVGAFAGPIVFVAALVILGEVRVSELARAKDVASAKVLTPARRRALAERWERLRPDMAALGPGMVAIGLMIVWAVYNGGYDDATWYWGALLLLALVGAVAWARRASLRLSRAATAALIAFALYVAWSYLSITWAESKGDALDGSNRALLYLLMFMLLAILPWTPRSALIALVTFALGVGAIGFVLLIRLAAGSHVGSLVIEGRLSAPTGYFNSNAALFMMAGLIATTLASRRELPTELRGALIATACADLQLAMIVQSRGWLFTLPIVLILWVVLVPDRLRLIGAAVLPTLAVLIPLHRLLDVYTGAEDGRLSHAATRAGTLALVLCVAALVIWTVISSAEALLRRPPLSTVRRRQIGAVVAASIVAVSVVGGVVATHGHPFRFIDRQWNAFSHETTASEQGSASHFAALGSGRYDFWRVSLDALAAHPVGGLGQDNFVDYYLLHRRTSEEPQWAHSLELQLLASTGVVGFLLFAVFLVAALLAARPGRLRSDGVAAAVAAACVLPLIVWAIHGSVDWFWAMPALSGPALGFLGVGVALSERKRSVVWRRERPRRVPGWVPALAAGVVFAGCAFVLGFTYLSVRETAVAGNIAATNPQGALHDLSLAADFDPLSSLPGRLAGEVALENHLYMVAEARFHQSLGEEPLGWLSWLGEGLAASELGDSAAARHDYEIADRIDNKQPAVKRALAQIDTRHPLSAAEALQLLVITP
ncbi:MAG TPA: oligosaccharide flippase family protein [Solirubrobacteraceae bacterium]|nr:oligosaccharide flippase family protein [Solirubrobacteraceae bacterium]